VGQTYNIVITGNFPGDVGPTYPGCEYNEDGILPSVPGIIVSIWADPNNPSYSLGTFTPTQITLTVTVAANSATGTAYLTLGCDGGNGCYATAPVQIGCPTPTITSISPNVWFAGQSYNLAIAGTGFITSASSAATGCPVSTVNVSTNNIRLTVPVSDTNVASATEITATVAPNGVGILHSTATFYGAGPATVEVINAPPANGGPVPGTTSGSAPNVDVLGAPQIQCSVASMSCFGQPINGTTQQAVVGQQIVLAGSPSATGLGGLPIPLTLVPPSAWTLEGTNIGGYSPTTAGASVTETVLTGSTLTTYWVYPGTFPVTYESCIEGQTASPALYECTTANATFNVTGAGNGGMGTSEPYPAGSIEELFVPPPCTADNTAQYMGYGNLTGPGPDCGGPQSGDAGIFFLAAGASPNGTYQFAQTISNDTRTYTSANGSYTCTTAPGIDTAYPYAGTVSAFDAVDGPEIPLPAVDTNASRTFNATMYLLWTSNAPNSNSIPVPIGYQAWQFQASTTNPDAPANQEWTVPLTQAHGPVGDFISADPSQPFYGYPTWSGRALETCPN
jgi:hypothetical protein